MSDISVLEKLWQEDCCEFQTGLAYTETLTLYKRSWALRDRVGT